MAAALFWKLLKEKGQDPDRFAIDTAGLAAGDGVPASVGALEAMRHEGLDISHHRSVQLTQKQVQQADLILTMTRSHSIYIRDNFSARANQIHTLTQYARETGLDIADPYGMGINQYIRTAQELKRVLGKIVDRIIASEIDSISGTEE